MLKSVAAKFERHRLERSSATDHRADPRRTGEGYTVDATGLRQQLSGGVTVNRVEPAGGKPGIVERFNEFMHRHRRGHSRLQHDAVSCRDGRTDLVTCQIQRRIVGCDRRNDADREAHDDAELAGALSRRIHRNMGALDPDRLFLPRVRSFQLRRSTSRMASRMGFPVSCAMVRARSSRREAIVAAAFRSSAALSRAGVEATVAAT